MSNILTFRLAVPSEQRALENLQRDASLVWEDDRAALLEHPDAIELPIEQITGGRTIVAERVGGTVGFAVVLRREDGDAELDGLFVDPRCWGQGIGRALIAESVNLSLEEGCSVLHVIANPRAMDFYKKLGFLALVEVPTRFRPAFRMRKDIVKS